MRTVWALLAIALLVHCTAGAESDEYSGDPLDSWLSPECQRFYNKKADVTTERTELAITRVDEDFYVNGRAHAMMPPHDAQVRRWGPEHIK